MTSIAVKMNMYGKMSNFHNFERKKSNGVICSHNNYRFLIFKKLKVAHFLTEQNYTIVRNVFKL